MSRFRHAGALLFALIASPAAATECPAIEVDEAFVRATGLGELYTKNVELSLSARGSPERNCMIEVILEGPFRPAIYAALDAGWTEDAQLMLLHSTMGYVGRTSPDSMTSWEAVTASYFEMIGWIEAMPAEMAAITVELTFESESLPADIAAGDALQYSDLSNPNYRAAAYVRAAKAALGGATN